METWKPVKGFENKYEISNYGRVRSKRKELKIQHDKDGYEIVKIHCNGNHSLRVHRLVAEAFIPNPEKLPLVNHKDENKQNNCVDNLEWCSHKYNVNYGNAQEKKSQRISKPVIQLNKNKKIIKIWKNSLEASKKLNIDHSNIIKCCKQKRNYAGNYIWKYESEVV